MSRIESRRSRRAAFTFLEIMMVVIIIGILAALVGPRLVGQTQKARIGACRAQVESLSNALKRFEMDMGTYPDGSEGLKGLVAKPSNDESNSWDGPYLDKGVPKDPWQQEYNYKFPGEHNTKDFDLWSNGPDRQSGTEDDITNWVKEAK